MDIRRIICEASRAKNQCPASPLIFQLAALLGAKTLLQWVSSPNNPNLVNIRGKTEELCSSHSDLALWLLLWFAWTCRLLQELPVPRLSDYVTLWAQVRVATCQPSCFETMFWTHNLCISVVVTQLTVDCKISAECFSWRELCVILRDFHWDQTPSSQVDLHITQQLLWNLGRASAEFH